MSDAKDETTDTVIDETDFDENLNFKSDVKAQLRQFVHDRPIGKLVDDLADEFGLNG